MRLAAFDPRVRTLNGMAYSARQRYLNALGCPPAQKMGRLRGLGRLRGIPFADGNWDRLAGLGRLGQGDVEFEPTTYDPGNLLVPPPDTSSAPPSFSTLLPGWQMPQPSAATLTPTTYDPTTGLIAPIMSMPASSSPGQPSLTAAQVAATASAIAPQVAALTLQPAGVAPSTIAGIPTSYFVYGGIAFLGVILFGSMSKKR